MLSLSLKELKLKASFAIFLDLGFALNKTKIVLCNWSKSTFGKLDREIQDCRKESAKWEQKAETADLEDDDRMKWMEVRGLWSKKESEKLNMLKHKARVKWATDGEENLKFFHSFIKRCKSKNNICGLTISGKWEEEPEVIKDAVHRYFKAIFEDKNSLMEYKMESVNQRLSSSESADLEARFNEQEIWAAIQGCDISKAPDPDGFPFKFLKKLWSIIKSDLMNAISFYWDRGEISFGCNASFVSLLLKKHDLMELED
ncbi:uncharacterized protein [Rutidosis leptorrhynchoides]|uniref:uncharacterized protein n=1 Tax=Rutidosis leptorrhynchoides TaxID=125765 RepID=UPI003A990B13